MIKMVETKTPKFMGRFIPALSISRALPSTSLNSVAGRTDVLRPTPSKSGSRKVADYQKIIEK
jgi:hypothetical protein